MSKPWEEDKPKPWQDDSDTVSDYVEGVNAQNEQHPDIGFGERLKLQNLGNSPDSKAAALRQQGFEAKAFSNEVLVRRPGEKEWKKLAPGGLELQDVTDNLWNIGAGTASTVAGAASAIAAAPETALIGSMPAAMLASGATSAGLEGVRQKWGQAAGIPQDVNMADVAIQGGAGMVAPAVFGTGASAKALAGKVDAEALKEAIRKSRSFITRGIEKVTPGLGEMFTGVPRQATKKLIEDPDVLNRMADGGANDLAEAAYRQVNEGVAGSRRQIGGDMQRLYENTGNSVEVGPAKAAFQERLNYLRSKTDITKAEAAEINALESAYEKYFNLATPKEVLEKTPEQLLKEEQVFKHLQRVNNSSVQAPQVPESIVNPLEQHYPKMDAKYSDLYLPDWTASGKLEKISGGYGDEAHQKLLKEYYENSQPAEKLKTVVSEANQYALDVAKQTKEARQELLLKKLKEINTPQIRTEIDNTASPQRAFDLQQKLRQAAAWSKDSTPENYSVQSSARNAWDAINKGLDTATEAASGDLKSQYGALKQFEPKVDKYFSDPEKTYNTLTNYSGENKRWLKNTMKDYEGMTKGATNLDDMAAQLQAYRYFENPSWTPISSGGTTSTSRTMNTAGMAGSLGYKLGGPPGQIFAHTVAHTLGGPKAMKAAIQAGQYTSRKVGPAMNPAAQSLWNTIYQLQKEAEEQK